MKIWNYLELMGSETTTFQICVISKKSFQRYIYPIYALYNIYTII